MPVEKVEGGYRWGKTGKVYKRRIDAVKQGQAIKAQDAKTGGAEGGLWANIHAKRARGEPMRKKGAKGAPTDKAFKKAQGLNKGGAMHRMPDGTMMKGAKHGYGHGGLTKSTGKLNTGIRGCE